VDIRYTLWLVALLRQPAANIKGLATVSHQSGNAPPPARTDKRALTTKHASFRMSNYCATLNIKAAIVLIKYGSDFYSELSNPDYTQGETTLVK